MNDTKHTPGPWIIATSNSWRRIISESGATVCEPTKQNDGHPDLLFPNGGQDGPDSRLITAAPALLEALLAEQEWRDEPDHHKSDDLRIKARKLRISALATARA